MRQWISTRSSDTQRTRQCARERLASFNWHDFCCEVYVEFTAEQKNLLERIFAEGHARGRAQTTAEVGVAVATEPTVFGTAIADLSKEERFKCEENGLDIWEKLARDVY